MKLFRIIEVLPEIEEDAGVTLDPAATDPSNTISPEDEKLVSEKKEEPASEEKAVSEEEAQDVEPASEEEPVSGENPASEEAASEDNGD
jgi:hypothetical protein